MLAPDTLSAIVASIESSGLTEATVGQLRERNPGVHFTFCLDDDVGHARPHIEARGFNVYLVDGREHCLKLTTSLEAATGLVLAEVIDDE